MSNIFLGDISNLQFKVGGADCSIYLGDTKLYPSEEPIPTPTYEWKQYNAGDTVPSKLFYGVKLGDPSMDTTSIEFGDIYNTGIDFVFDINYGWYAQDMSGEQIDISEYFDETERCYIIYFSDLGYGAMPISYPTPNSSFEFDVQLYEEHIPTLLNIITYNASAKLSEAPSEYEGGLHTNAFSGTNGQQLTMTNHAFENGVGTIEFDGDIASIGNGAFYICSSLTNITIPDSVTSIGMFAFYSCGLTSLTILDSITSIGENAFSNCSSLTSCTIGSGITSISNYAFDSCGLASVTIPDSVTSISIEAFRQCSNLTSVTIGSGITSISSAAFRYCSSLTSITVNATTPPTLGGTTVFDDTNNCPIYVPAASLETYKTANRWSDYASRIQAIPT